jgi:hypothetical protein
MNTSLVYSYASHIAEVDLITGEASMEDYVTVHHYYAIVARDSRN